MKEKRNLLKKLSQLDIRSQATGCETYKDSYSIFTMMLKDPILGKIFEKRSNVDLKDRARKLKIDRKKYSNNKKEEIEEKNSNTDLKEKVQKTQNHDDEEKKNEKESEDESPIIKRARVEWSTEEENALKEGLQKYSDSKKRFANILKDEVYGKILENRGNVALKDKERIFNKLRLEIENK